MIRTTSCSRVSMDKKLRIIVGGHSEKESIPVFLRNRYFADNNCYIEILPVLRTTEGRLKHLDKLCNEIDIAIRYYGPGPVLVLFDADDKICPKKYMDDARDELKVRFPNIDIFIVIAKWETETWFIPAIESLRGVRGIPDEARPPENLSELESINSKSWIERCMGGKYKETQDQPAFMDAFDYKAVAECEHARSFHHFLKALDEIIELCADKPPE